MVLHRFGKPGGSWLRENGIYLSFIQQFYWDADGAGHSDERACGLVNSGQVCGFERLVIA